MQFEQADADGSIFGAFGGGETRGEKHISDVETRN